MKTMTMKAQNNHDFNLVIVDSERYVLPSFNEEYSIVDGRDGPEHQFKELGTGIVKVQFFKVNMSVKQWMEDRKKIAEWLFSKKELEITFDDEPDIYYIGKVTESDIPENYKPSVSFWVTLTMQPLKYGAIKEVTNKDEVDTYAEEEEPHERIDADYKGTYEAPFLLTLEDVTTDELIVSINDVDIKYEGDLSDDTVTIDTKELELRVNGELRVLEVEGHFSFLQSGGNEIKINTETTATLTWQELFL